jgi:ABC-type sugar transport system substrate-binding protein
MKSLFRLVGPFALLGVLWGCSNSTSSPIPSGPAGPGAAGAGAKVKIAAIGLQEDQFYRLIDLGMKDAAQKLNVDLSTSNASGSLDKEISLIDTLTAQKPDAIVVAPQSVKASIPALQRAHDAGIKIVTYDAHIEADFPASDVRSDMISLGALTGKEAVDYINTKMGGKANVAIVAYNSLAAETSGQRTKGFKDEIAKLPGVKVVAEQDAWIAANAITVVEGILTAHPEVNLIWSANEGGTVGAVTAVKNAGKAGKIVVFGTDISEQMADFLLSDDNILQAVTGQKPFDIGSMAIENAVKVAKGEKVEKQVTTPGLLFSRRKPDEVKKYRDYLHGLAK